MSLSSVVACVVDVAFDYAHRAAEEARGLGTTGWRKAYGCTDGLAALANRYTARARRLTTVVGSDWRRRVERQPQQPDVTDDVKTTMHTHF